MATSNKIDAQLLAKMFLSAAKTLDAKKEWINELNVFPVPDGDTGTNMTLTVMSAVREVNALGSNPSFETLSKAISSGSLRGARGNSGVITSQLLRGFCKEIKHVDEINIEVISKAFVHAKETAYKAVMKPKEGTILTVAKGMSDKAVELYEAGATDLDEYLTAIVEYGNKVLAHTPELLPVLKQAGVVDSGGQGLMVLMTGALECFKGKEIDLNFKEDKPIVHHVAEAFPKFEGIMTKDKIDTANIKFGYCTEFIIKLEKKFTEEDEAAFKDFLLSIGDSLVCVSDDEMVKIHVHTNHPGQAFEKGIEYGQLTRMKIDNMREEHEERVALDAELIAAEEKRKKAAEPKKKYGFISVAAGQGMNAIFTELGVDYMISGGQTMNPSTDDMLQAIDEINAENIFILPNNKNIIMAADQAKSLTKDKNIIVVPSKTIPQGITAIINFDPDSTPDENAETMKEAMAAVATGSITYAVRDTSIDDHTITKGDIMGLGDKGLLAVGKEIAATTVETVQAMVTEDSELISIYYGEGVTKEDAEALQAQVAKLYPAMDVVLQEGSQPVYYYILSVE